MNRADALFFLFALFRDWVRVVSPSGVSRLSYRLPPFNVCLSFIVMARHLDAPGKQYIWSLASQW